MRAGLGLPVVTEKELMASGETRGSPCETEHGG